MLCDFRVSKHPKLHVNIACAAAQHFTHTPSSSGPTEGNGKKRDLGNEVVALVITFPISFFEFLSLGGYIFHTTLLPLGSGKWNAEFKSRWNYVI